MTQNRSFSLPTAGPIFSRGIYKFDSKGDSVSTSAQHLLTLLLVISLVAVLIFLIVPLTVFRKKFPMTRAQIPNLFFCLFVGLGYIIIEISMINRL